LGFAWSIFNSARKLFVSLGKEAAYSFETRRITKLSFSLGLSFRLFTPYGESIIITPLPKAFFANSALRP
jgi:hypothetical protein